MALHWETGKRPRLRLPTRDNQRAPSHRLKDIPLPSAPSNSATSDSIQNTSSPRTSPGAPEGDFSKATHVPQSLRLRDLHVPVKQLRHVLDASVNLLRVGSSRLDETEYLLGLEQVDFAQQEFSEKILRDGRCQLVSSRQYGRMRQA